MSAGTIFRPDVTQGRVPRVQPLAALPRRPGGERLDPVTEALVRQAPLRALLIQSALLAQARGMQDEAERIRSVLIALGVDQVLLDVARAIVLLRRGKFRQSAQLIERDVLLADPGHELARAVLIRAWREEERPGWKPHANALLASTRCSRVQRMLADGI